MATERAGSTDAARVLLDDERAFAGDGVLPRSVSWRSGVLVALGAALLVTVSLGPMAGELGALSPWVWILTACVGALQCALLAELTSRFSGRAGGTAQFAYRALRRGSPALGALSSWSYWFAWTPGIAVNLILAATYIRTTVLPGVNTLVLAAGIGGLLYVLNSTGLRLSMRLAAVLSVLTVIPLGLVAAGPVIRPSAFHITHLVPIVMPTHAPRGAFGVTGLVMKWTFVAAWSAYGAEMASTLCAEIRRPGRDMPRAMIVAAVVCLVAFGVTPIALIGIVGAEVMAKDPLVVFARAAQVLFGSAGGTVVGLLLAAGLVLGAQAFILGSSRTIYQLSCDGHLPRAFARVNRWGVPIGSIVWDAVVIAFMLLVFGTRIVDVVAAANVGYLIVFLLLPLAFLVLRRHPDGEAGGLRLPHAFAGVAIALIGFNAVVLVWGGMQWGASVMLVGIGVSLLILPMSWVTRRLVASPRAGGRPVAAVPTSPSP